MFKREKIQSYYLYDTSVENVFINEFLPDAPGDYVKIFLFALMYADIGATIGNEDIAKQLSIKIEEVLAAWTYWEEKGLVEKEYTDKNNQFAYNVIFIGLKDKIFCNNGRAKKKEDAKSKNLPVSMEDQELKELYRGIEQAMGRILQGREPLTVMNWIKDYNLSKDYILYAFDFCKKERNNTAINYVGAVIKDWFSAGLNTVEAVENYLEENSNRHYLYKRVMRALGFLRNPTEEEQRIMDVWFDDLSLNINEVLEACKKTSGISNPNINYVNKVLTSPRSGGGGSRGAGSDRSSGLGGGGLISAVMKSYEEDRRQAEEGAEARRKEVYEQAPKIKEIDDKIRAISIDITKEMLAKRPDTKEIIEDLKKQQNKLLDEKAYLLTENNFRLNYMDIAYKCDLCKDEGLLEDGSRCSCFGEKLETRMKELEKNQAKEYNEA